MFLVIQLLKPKKCAILDVMKNKASQTRTRPVPQFLQPFLWSVNIQELKKKKDKIYIIHQILSYGNLKALSWLLRTYSKQEIREVFLEHPVRVYRKATLNFVHQILLGLKTRLQEKRYVTTFPSPLKRGATKNI